VVVGVVAVVGAPLLTEWLESQSQVAPPLQVGTSAPDFELETLEGETVRLSQFQGQPVLLIFSASWCPACRAEAPLVQEVHEDHPELVILLVDLEETAAVARRFADDMGMTHPVLLDRNGQVGRMYHIFAIPASFFIDVDGVLRAMLVEELTPDYLAKTLPLIGVAP
jgi:peroxiredoxin